MTKDELKADMLSEIDSSFDTSEGSFFSDAITPAAIELEKSYAAMDSILNNAFVGTASGGYLERKCSELGINRKPATKATGQVEITGTVGANIVAGSLVSSELTNFVITDNKVIGATGKELVSVECDQFGIAGNVPVGSIKYFPVTLEGITAVTNPAVLSNGYDAESDESLRQRYYEKINMPATSGNIYHYKQWAKAVEGVGDARVYPTWSGAGTVKVVICDRNKRAALPELISEVEDYIETNRPIGADVTVASATEKSINITATIVLGNGRTLEDVEKGFSEALTDYFKNTAFIDTYISFAKVGSILYGLYGVEDYSSLKLNNTTANINIAEKEVPVLGTVVLS
ncbi:MAG: baseplate J/gp47 family protein [Eubacteriales bacterium]|nr:baseplate J/gp47 family protein [Eubacteriales bacterium]